MAGMTYNNRLSTVRIDWLNLEADYTYDQAGRLTGLTNFNGTQTTYTYDNANRLITTENRSGGASISSYGFTLDGNASRTSATLSEPYQTTPTAENVAYTYNDKKNRLLTSGANGFAYNNEGQLNSGYGATYAFDYEHRLTAIGTDAQFSYDYKGNRLQAIRNGTITRYIYDPAGNLLGETDGGNNITKYYIHGLGLLAMVTSTGQVFTYHYNPIGSTIAVTDLGQNVVNAYAYDSFGNILNQTENIPQPFKYVGQFGVMAESNGFYYMRARYYDPQAGRFISEDPIGFDGGDVNLYGYVGGNAVNRVDPSGLASGDWWDIPANFQRAIEIAREELARRPNAHSDSEDAMRHAEWNRRMVIETNSFTAWVAGVGHEIVGSIKGQPWNEAMMDMYNNWVGRDAGARGELVDPDQLQKSPDNGFLYNNGGCRR